MSKHAWLLAALLLSLSLAGCSKPKAGGTADEDDCSLEPALCDPDGYLASHPCIANDWTPRVYAPDTPGPESAANPWKQGDYWTYRISRDGEASTTTLVYYDDSDFNARGEAQHYLVGTATEEEALDHALFSVNPMIGRIHRTLYSPHESGLHSDMFYFPLCPGSNWISDFYGTTFQMKASQATLQLPGGQSDPLGFRIQGTSPDGSTLTHTYSSVVKWFTQIDLRRADGLQLKLDLTAFGSGKSGEFHFLRAQKDEVIDLSAAAASTPVDREDGGEGPYDRVAAYMEVARAGGTGRIEVHLRDPAGTSRACVGIAGSGPLGATQCPAGPLKVEVPYAAGAWTVTLETPAFDSQTKASGEVRVVSVYDRSGTV